MTEEIIEPSSTTESKTLEQNQRAEVAIAEIQSNLGDAKIEGDTLARHDELMKKPERDESQKKELKKLRKELEERFGSRTPEVLSKWEKAKDVRAAARELEK